MLSQKNPKEKLCLLSVLNSTEPRLPGESARTVTTSSTTSSNEQSGAELSLLERRVIFKQNLRKTEDSRMEIFERTQEQRKKRQNNWFRLWTNNQQKHQHLSHITFKDSF